MTPHKHEPKLELLELKDIFPTPNNPRKVNPKSADIAELARAIKAQGVLEPVLVRPHPTYTKDPAKKWMLMAGERRFTAAGNGGLTHIPCMVYTEMSDEDALKITIVENLHSEDVPPLEQAERILQLTAGDMTIQQVADELGKPLRWVAMRAKLSNLSEPWRKAAKDGNHPVSHWPVTHLEAVARFDTATQADILNRYAIANDFGDNEHAVISIKELRHELAQFLHIMKGTPWPLDDATVLKSAGACSDCVKRTACDQQADLFALSDFTSSKGKVDAGDRCMDVVCWDRKMTAYVQQEVDAMKALHGDALVLVSDTADELPWPTIADWNLKAVNPNAVGGARKDTFPCLYVHGPKAGVEFLGKKAGGAIGGPEDGGGATKAASPTKDPASKFTPLNDRRARLDLKRKQWVIGEVMRAVDLLAKGEEELPELLIETKAVFVSNFGLSHVRGKEPFGDGKDVWAVVTSDCKERVLIPTVIDHMFRSALRNLHARISYSAKTGVLPGDDLKHTCKFLELDLKKLREESVKEHPEPKSWSHMNEDGSPKAKGPVGRPAKSAAKKKAAKPAKSAAKKPTTKKLVVQKKLMKHAGKNSATLFDDPNLGKVSAANKSKPAKKSAAK